MSGEKENVFHALEVREVFEMLETSVRGLSSQEAEKRLREYGPNELEEEKKTSVLNLVFNQVRSPIIMVLFAAILISLAIGKVVDAAVIGVVIAFNTVIGFTQEFKAEKALQALKRLTAPEAKVVRDCPESGGCVGMRVKAREIVPGDVILLEAGDRVPADARIFEAFNMEIDESMLTGESTPVEKTTEPLEKNLPVAERRNIAFAGTIVTKGRGKAVVFATGVRTEIGKIAHLIRETEKIETPIQKRTSDLSKKLGVLALSSSSLMVIVGVLRGFEFFEMFLFALAAAVSAIPEGLPVVITVTLAIGVNRMARRNAIIRRLQAVDTLGSVTAICTDKTGTLTTNQMTVQEIFVAGRTVKVTGSGFTPEGRFILGEEPIDPLGLEPLKLLLQAGALCNNSRLIQHEVDGFRWEVHGDPTEGALVVAAAKAGLRKEELEELYPRVDEIPFDPQERYMATFHKAPSGVLTVYAKGAPKTILEMCSEYLNDGERKKLSEEKKEEVLEVSRSMAGRALRVLAVAFLEISDAELERVKTNIRVEPRMVFIGLVGMIDPPRPEAKTAVQLCKRAGIKVLMLTGDHRLTAQAIASELGILKPGSKVLTGMELDQMSDEELDAVVEDVVVFARVSPLHKHRIVQSLRRRGHVVAMTGDGVNDAPALKTAEVGIAMGITGTDVTKETADMVLVDDNFASIVNAVEEGRMVFENIRKVVKYLISTNLGEIITIFAALFLLPDAPVLFTPIQILWVNLVTDGLITVTLAMEPKEEDVMDQPPRKPGEKIINRDILLNTIYVSTFMAVGSLWIFTREWVNGDLTRTQTMTFTVMAIFQVFNALNCRSRTKSVFKIGFFTNKYLFAGVVSSFSLQVLATILPPFQAALQTKPLSPWDWATIILVSSTVFIADEIRKLIRAKLKKAG
ncbi:MAG: HAD-IC family P-type ATPase [Thermoproteota archaeon]|nr:HAD-IC family P-type ATPase [Candidatus Brockarchaeota archaeon]